MKGLLKQFGVRLVMMIVILFLLFSIAYVLVFVRFFSVESLVLSQFFVVLGILIWIIATFVICIKPFAKAFHVSGLLMNFPLQIQNAKGDYHDFIEVMYCLQGLESEQKAVTLMWLGTKPGQDNLESALTILNQEHYPSDIIALVRDQTLPNVDVKQRFLDAFKDLSVNAFDSQDNSYCAAQFRFRNHLEILLLLHPNDAVWLKDVVCAAMLGVSHHLEDVLGLRNVMTGLMADFFVLHGQNGRIESWKIMASNGAINSPLKD